MAICKSIPATWDKERNLRITTHSMVQMEKKTGVKLMGLNLQSVGFTEICALMYAALLHEDKDFTPERAETIMDECGLTVIMPPLTEALNQFMAVNAENPQIQAGQ